MKKNSGVAITGLFTAACMAPFLGKAFHMDEPFYLAVGRQILKSPLHPFAFSFNWYGRNVPFVEINNTPPLFAYVVAGALKITGGSEFGMRLLFLLFPVLSAAALYLIAARFLKRPLLPALICCASPVFLINMGLLYPEVLSAAFGFFGLYFLVRGVDEDSKGFYWGSAGLIAVALLCKYFAIFLLLPAVGYGLARGLPIKRLAVYAALCVSGLAALIVFDRLTGPAVAGAIWQVLAEASTLPVWNWAHKLRSILCFVGGGGLAVCLWPLAAARPRPRAALALGVFCLFLFSPWLDLAPIVRPLDRLTGFLMGTGAAFGFWRLFAQDKRSGGWALWAPWTVSSILVLSCLYWSILARLALFAVPPLIYSCAETLEASWSEASLRRFYAATLALTLSLTFSLGWVDFHYAQSQKRAAEEIMETFGHGRQVWTLAHWGMQYYLEQGGAKEIDFDSGGWDSIRPGDVAIVTRLSSPPKLPRKLIHADVKVLTIDERLPLRLMSGWKGEAGFYSNVMGFLPYCVSSEPLEEITIIRRLE